jgi:trk system potassium uptake protein
MARSTFANLGFLLQISGILTVLPIGIGLYYNETRALIPLFITCIAFLGIGFLLNALCERKDLNLKSASILLLSTFIILPLIGAIPYLYLDPFNSPNTIDLISNSYFESVSGFTTTGFSFITNIDAMQRSMLVFRSLTEVMGGIGIIFIILAFFQSKKSLLNLGNTVGIENTNGNYRKMFLWVFSIYGLFILVFTGIYYALGLTDLIKTGSFVIDTLTGGFSPSAQQMPQYLFAGSKVLMIVLMTLGSINFAFNYHLFTGKIKKMFTKEVSLYLLIIAASSVAIFLSAKLDFIDSLFHVVSMASSTGIDYVNIQSLNGTAISIFIILIVVGGCSFSMAGGIKISRIVTFLKSIITSIQITFVKGRDNEYYSEEEIEKSHEQIPIVVSILLFLALLLVFTLLFSTLGVSFSDSIFEMGSALSTNGVSMGAINVAMPAAYKWLTVAAMSIGRVEILTILIALIPIKVYASTEQSAMDITQ